MEERIKIVFRSFGFESQDNSFRNTQKFLLIFAPPCKILGYINEVTIDFFQILQTLSLVFVANIQFGTI